MDQLHRMTTRGMGALLLAVVVAAAGCSGADEAAVPDGFTTTDAGALSLSHPSDWEVLSQDAADLRVAAAGEDPVRPSAAASIDPAYGDGADGFEAAVTGTLTVLAAVRQDLEQGGVETIDVPGADAARMVTSTFTVDGTTVDHVDLFVLAPDGRLVHARAEAPSGMVGLPTLRDVVRSVRVA